MDIAEIVLDATLDSIKMLPFLFVAFYMIEVFEKLSGEFPGKTMMQARKAGPVIGALLGCIPQCGFSVLGSNLYAERIISAGTLLSIFLATSDEAILIILGSPGYIKEVAGLILAKLCIAIIAGYLVNFLFGKTLESDVAYYKIVSDCETNEKKEKMLKTVCTHTVKIFLYIYAVNLILGFLIEAFGMERISAVMLNGTIIQPFVTAIVGLIPNCAASVILTQFYLHGAISFASVISGLCTGAGVGLIVLFRVNKDRRENLRILGLLYIISVISGMIIQVLFG